LDFLQIQDVNLSFFYVAHNLTSVISLFLSREVSLEENLKLKDELDLDEKEAHESVKLLLRKYERFRVTFVSRFIQLILRVDIQCMMCR